MSIHTIISAIISELDSNVPFQLPLVMQSGELCKLIYDFKTTRVVESNYYDSNGSEFDELVSKLRNITAFQVSIELIDELYRFTRYISLNPETVRISMIKLPHLTRFHLKNCLSRAIHVLDLNLELGEAAGKDYSLLVDCAIISILLYEDAYLTNYAKYYLHALSKKLINVVARDISAKIFANSNVENVIILLKNDIILLQAAAAHASRHAARNWSKNSLLADVLSLDDDEYIGNILEYILESNAIELPRISVDKYSTGYDYELINLFVSNKMIAVANIENCIHLLNDDPREIFYETDFVETDTAKSIIKDMSRLIRTGNNCLVLYGSPGCGITTYINHLSQLLNVEEDPITFYLDDTADYQSLIGNWSTSSTTGIFKFEYGLLAKAISSGFWVVLVSVDKCAEDVRVLLKEIIQSGRLYIKELDETVYVHPNFFIFATLSSGNYSDFVSDRIGQDTSFVSFWPKLFIPPTTINDLNAIISRKFHQILPIKDLLITAFFDTVEFIQQIGIERVPRPSDLLKICKRIVNLTIPNEFIIDRPIHKLDGYLTTFTREMILLAAESVLFGFIGDKCKRLQVASKWAFHFQLTESQAEHYIFKSKFTPSASWLSNLAASNPKYSLTNTHSRLLRQMIECLIAKESVLLVGDTGVGKTSAVQTLAQMAGKKLKVYVFSEQSEASDLIGSFYPHGLKYKFTRLLGKICYAVSVSCHGDAKATGFIDKLNCMIRNGSYNDFISTMMCFTNIAQKFDIWRNISREIGALAKEIRFNKSNAISAADMPRLLGELNLKANSIGYKIDEAEPVSFKFQDGPLTECIRKGGWILLDELNLAPSHLLHRLVGIIKQGQCKHFDLFENSERVLIHPDFKLFACLNPSKVSRGGMFEYSGKKDLDFNIKRLFTEIYVDELLDFEDLLIIVETFFPDKAEYHRLIVQYYLDILEMARKSQLMCSDTRSSPLYSLRNFSRALSYTRNVIEQSMSKNFLGALRNGFLSCFASSLCVESEDAVGRLFDELFGRGPPDCPDGFVELADSDDFIVTSTVKSTLIKIVRVLQGLNAPLLLEGPTCVGKTTLIKYLAERFNRRVVRINNHENTEIQEYLGSFQFNQADNQIVFREGVLVDAARKGHWLLLDELNLAPSEVLEALNRVLDDNREMIIPETNAVISPHPNFMIFATQNPANSVYGGRKQLSRALKNRFILYNIPELPFCEWEEIICRRFKLPRSRSSAMVSVYKDMCYYTPHAMAFLGATCLVTTRDLIKWCSRLPSDDFELSNIGWSLLGERQRSADGREAVERIFQRHLRSRVSVEYQGHDIIRAVSRLCPGYVINRAFARLVSLIHQGLMAREPLLLIGETGTGKTTACQLVAKAMGLSITIVNLHLHTDASDLIGSIKPRRVPVDLYLDKLRGLALLLQDYEKSIACVNDFAGFGEMPQIVSEQLRDCVEYIGSFREIPSLDAYSLMKQIVLDILAFTAEMDGNRSDIIWSGHPKKRCKNIVAEIKRSIAELCPVDKFEWVDGPVVDVMRRGGILVLDEISLAEDAVLEKLNPVLEGGTPSLTLTDKGSSAVETVVARDDFYVIATMNPGNDFGKRELSPALANRFTQIWVPELPMGGEEFGQFVLSLIDFQHQFHLQGKLQPLDLKNLAKSIQQILVGLSELGIPVSIRDVKSLIEYLFSAENSCTPLKALFDGLQIFFTYSLAEPMATRVQSYLLDAISREFPEFYGANNAHKNLLDKIKSAMGANRFILLEGPAGVGKTSTVTALSNASSKRLVKINISQQTELMDLLGTFVPNTLTDGHSFRWRDGPLVEAMKRGDWVLLDEINLAAQPVLEGLNSLLDHRREVYLDQVDKLVKCESGFFLFASQNSASDGGGRKFLPKSFLNRFTVICCPALNRSDCESILSKTFPIEPELASLVSELIHDLDAEFSGLGYLFNLRDAIRLCSFMCSGGKSGVFEGVKLTRSDVHAFLLSRFRDRGEFSRALQMVYSKLGMLSDSLPRANQSSQSFSYTYGQLRCAPSSGQINLLELMHRYIESFVPVVITGPDQSGKASLVRWLAAAVGAKLVEIPIFPSTDAYDLLGSFEQINADRHLEKFRQAAVGLRKNYPRSVMKKLLQKKLPASGDATDVDEILAQYQLPQELRSAWSDVKALASSRCPGFRWVDGPLVDAVVHGHWVLLKRVDLAQPAVLDRLNALLEAGTPGGAPESTSGAGDENFTLFECGYLRSIPIKRADPSDPRKGFRVFMTNSYQSNLSKPVLNRCIQLNMLSFDQHDASTFITPYIQFAASLLKQEASGGTEITFINSLRALIGHFTEDCLVELMLIVTVYSFICDASGVFDLQRLLQWSKLFQIYRFESGFSPDASFTIKNAFAAAFGGGSEFQGFLGGALDGLGSILGEALDGCGSTASDVKGHELVNYVKYLLHADLRVNPHSFAKYLLETGAPFDRLYSTLSVMADTLGAQALDGLGLHCHPMRAPQLELFFALQGTPLSCGAAAASDSESARMALLNAHRELFLLGPDYAIDASASLAPNWSFLPHSHFSHLAASLLLLQTDTPLRNYRNAQVSLQVYSTIYSCMLERLRLQSFSENAVSLVKELEDHALCVMKRLNSQGHLGDSVPSFDSPILSHVAKRLLLDVAVGLPADLPADSPAGNGFSFYLSFYLSLAKRSFSRLDLDLIAGVSLVKAIKSLGGQSDCSSSRQQPSRQQTSRQQRDRTPQILGIKEFYQKLIEMPDLKIDPLKAAKTELGILALKNALSLATCKIEIDKIVISGDFQHISKNDAYELIFNTPLEYFGRVSLPNEIIQTFKESIGEPEPTPSLGAAPDNEWLRLGWHLLSTHQLRLAQAATLRDMKMADCLTEIQLWQKRSQGLISAQSDLAILTNPHNTPNLYDASFLSPFKAKLENLANVKSLPADVMDMLNLDDSQKLTIHALDELIMLTREFIATFFDRKMVSGVISNSLDSDAINIAKHALDFISHIQLTNPFAVNYTKPIQVAFYCISYGLLSEAGPCSPLGGISCQSAINLFGCNFDARLPALLASRHCASKSDKIRLNMIILSWCIKVCSYDAVLPVLTALCELLAPGDSSAEFGYRASNLQRAIEEEAEFTGSECVVDKLFCLLFPDANLSGFHGSDPDAPRSGAQTWESVGACLETPLCSLIKDTYKLSVECQLRLFSGASEWACRTLFLNPGNNSRPEIASYNQALQYVLDKLGSFNQIISDMLLDNLVAQITKMQQIRPELLTLNSMVSLLDVVRQSLEHWNNNMGAASQDFQAENCRPAGSLYFDLLEFDKLALAPKKNFIASWENLPREKLKEMSSNAFRYLPKLAQLSTEAARDGVDETRVIGEIDEFLRCPACEHETRMRLLQFFAKITPNPLSNVLSNCHIMHCNPQIAQNCNEHVRSARVKIAQIVAQGTKKIEKAQMHRLKRSVAQVMHQLIKDITMYAAKRDDDLALPLTLAGFITNAGCIAEMCEYITQTIDGNNLTAIKRCLKEVKLFAAGMVLPKSRGYNYSLSLDIIDTDWNLYPVYRDCLKLLMQVHRLGYNFEDPLLPQLISHAQAQVIASFDESLNSCFTGRHSWRDFTRLFRAFTSLLRGLEILNELKVPQVGRLYRTFNEFYGSVKPIQVAMVHNFPLLDKSAWAVNDIYMQLRNLIESARVQLGALRDSSSNSNISRAVADMLQHTDEMGKADAMGICAKGERGDIGGEDAVVKAVSHVLFALSYYKLLDKARQLEEEGSPGGETKQSELRDEWVAGTGLASTDTADGQTRNLEQEFNDDNQVEFPSDPSDPNNGQSDDGSACKTDLDWENEEPNDFAGGVSDDGQGSEQRYGDPDDFELSNGACQDSDGQPPNDNFEMPLDHASDASVDTPLGASPMDHLEHASDDPLEDASMGHASNAPLDHARDERDERDSQGVNEDSVSEDSVSCSPEDGASEACSDASSNGEPQETHETRETHETHAEDTRDSAQDYTEHSEVDITLSMHDKDGRGLTRQCVDEIISLLDAKYEEANSLAPGNECSLVSYGESIMDDNHPNTNANMKNTLFNKSTNSDANVNNVDNYLNFDHNVDESDIHTNHITQGGLNSARNEADNRPAQEFEHETIAKLEVENGIQDWKQLEQKTSSSAVALGEELKRILEPTIKGRLQGNYKSGKRLSMKKVMLFIASGYKKDKIWLRRTKLSKFGHYIMLALDNSASMLHGEGGRALVKVALEAFALITQALNKIDLGNVCLYSFGSGEPKELLPMNQKITSEIGGKLVERFTFSESSSDSHQQGLANMLQTALYEFSKVKDNAKKILFIITDGKFNKKRITPIVERVINAEITPVLIIIDQQRDGPMSIVNMKQVIQEGKNIKVESFFHNFPFPLYAIIHNVDALPNILCDLIRQWFKGN